MILRMSGLKAGRHQTRVALPLGAARVYDFRQGAEPMTLYDESGNGIDGVLAAAPGTPTWTDGLAFDGSNDIVTFVGPTLTEAVTVILVLSLLSSATLYPLAISGSDKSGMVSYGEGVGMRFFGATGKPEWIIATAGGTFVKTATSTISDTGYRFLAGTYDGAAAALYVDGISVGEPAPANGAFRAFLTDWAFGNTAYRYARFYPLKGTLAFAAVYTRALVQAEITQAYQYVKATRGIAIV
jgi:hypothetical protein